MLFLKMGSESIFHILLGLYWVLLIRKDILNKIYRFSLYRAHFLSKIIELKSGKTPHPLEKSDG